METSIQKLLRRNIASFKAYSSARQEFDGKGMIFLDANENPNENGVNRYPDPQQEQLKKLLSLKNEVSAEQIVVGNGSDEILDLIIRAFVSPGKEGMISLKPSYGMYKVLAELNDVFLDEIPFEEDFEINIENLLDAVRPETKLMLLCSPNNPTGKSLSLEQIENLLDRFQGIVVVDEAYIDFSNSPSAVSILRSQPRLIVCQTLSKAYAMAGLRVGYAMASPQITRVLNAIKPPYNVNTLSQEKAIELLRDKETFEAQLEQSNTERGFLLKALKYVPIVKKVYPSEANFILFEVDNADLRYKQLKSKGIVVRNRNKDFGCKNCLRLSVGLPEQNIKFIKTLNSLK